MRILIFLLLAAGSLIGPAVAASPLVNGSESIAQTRRKTKVDVKYDKKKDVSTVWLEELVLWKNPIGFQQVTMGLTFDFPKRTILTPKLVSIRFSSATQERSPFLGETLEALVDDVRLDLGKLGDMDKRSLTPTPGASLIHRIRTSISYQDFAKLAQARSLTLMVAGKDYKLSTDQIQILRDFLELMQAQGQEFK